MKILQLIQRQQLRGAEIFASQLSEHLVSGGHEVILVSIFEGSAELPFSGKKECLGASPGRRFIDVPSWKKLSDIVRQFDPDIVQANAGDTLKYAVLSKLFFRWHSKVIFRNANVMSAFLKGRFHRRFNVWLLRQCDYFISVSENCRKDLIKLCAFAADASTSIPIGAKSFDDVKAVLRNIPIEEPVFISIGTFVPEKNHLFLIEVFNLYYRLYKKGFLWLVGDGKLRSVLEEKILLYGIKDRVQFWGYSNNVISILKASDVFIMPSLIEGLPAVILEAISCGVPVVASAVGGIPEIIENDVTGICIEGWSDESYVQQLSALLNNIDLRNRLIMQARKTFLEKFTLEKVCGNFEACYEKLIRPDNSA